MKTKTDPWGRVIVSPDDAVELLLSGLKPGEFFVEDGPKVKAFNDFVRARDHADSRLVVPETPHHSPEEEHARRASEWLIPAAYREIDVLAYCADRCTSEAQMERLAEEYALFEEREMIPILQLMIYLVDSFRERGIVWGVGRGSSVASLALYLIGVHKIDPLRYGLSIRDFLK